MPRWLVWHSLRRNRVLSSNGLSLPPPLGPQEAAYHRGLHSEVQFVGLPAVALQWILFWWSAHIIGLFQRNCAQCILGSGCFNNTAMQLVPASFISLTDFKACFILDNVYNISKQLA